MIISGFGINFLLKWLATRRPPKYIPITQEKSDVYHAAVIDELDPRPSDYMIPPGNYPVSHCRVEDLHGHVKKEYEKYATLGENKAFVADHECNEGYYVHNAPTPEDANKTAYDACHKRTPGRCAVVSTNKIIYSHQ